MRPLRLALSALILAGSLTVGARRVGPLPALGAFLSPAHGVWAVAAGAELPPRAVGAIPTLEQRVTVRYDDRGVPHLFALSREDALRAMGYVVARDRLFQLEIQARATAGTLTEWMGEGALGLDRRSRALGLARAADREWDALDPESDAVRLTTAFAEGVNARIAALGPGDLPLEYHLLGVRPATWHPKYSLYLIARMSEILSYVPSELDRDRVVALVGPAAADALFPIHAPIQEPIQPEARAYPRFDLDRLPPPRPPAETARASAGASLARVPRRDGPRPAASNNWAVSPSRSATGNALLAGDPHLELTLPSIWYEAHLLVAGELDVYGVTIPGAPAIVIGFNRDVAWSFTNTGADVLDFYEETLDDAERPTRYLLDGQWRPLERRIEEYRDRRGRVLAVDTIVHTHRGPVRREDGRALSMRWTALEAGGSAMVLFDIAGARSVDEWLGIMERWLVPAQNGVVADRHGNIALRSTGWYPIRPGDGRGDVIRDGTTSESDWIGRWPVRRYPLAANPQQGYVASANQEPVDPRSDPGYLGVDWWVPWRAMRINRLLREDSAVTPEAMARYQTDPGSERADLFVPRLVAAVAERGEGDEELAQAAALLAEWDRRYTKANTRAVLFEEVVESLRRLVWDELQPPDGEDGGRGARVATPMDPYLLVLLDDPDSEWWDRRDTEPVEGRSEVVAEALRDALRRVRERYGPPEGDNWRWDRIRNADVLHYTGIRALSRLAVPVQGGTETLNPSPRGGRWGASWRMVVELGDSLAARTIYPGGQSGNPVSPWYADRIGAWSEGELEPVLVPRAPEDLPPGRLAGVLTLEPGS